MPLNNAPVPPLSLIVPPVKVTTEPNAEVGALHPKAMPVILTTKEEIETWLTAPWEEAGKLQRPLPDDMLIIVDAPAKVDDEQPEQRTLL